jgi:hypothetical protein
MAGKSTHRRNLLAHTPSMLKQVLDSLFDDLNSQPAWFSASVEQWLASSKAFFAFAQIYQSKIRKKIRMSRDEEEKLALFCELYTAHLLLREPKFDVAYEPYGKDQGRSPDYAVTFRTTTPFHVEVTRLRTSLQERQFESTGDVEGEDVLRLLQENEARRFVGMVCDKFKQLSPNTPNVLWVWSESDILLQLDVGTILRDLKRRIEQRDAELFARFAIEKPADFIRYYQRLSAVLIVGIQGHERIKAHLWWQNGDAKYPLPTRIANPILQQVSANS